MTDEIKNDNTEADVKELHTGESDHQIASSENEERDLEAVSKDEERQLDASSDTEDEDQLEADAGVEDEDEDQLEADAEESEDDFALDVQVAGSGDSDDGPVYVDQNQKRLLQSMRLEARIEAVIFASQKPLKVNELSEILGDEDLADEDIQSTIDQLIQDYENRVGGFTLKYVARMGYQFQTANEAGPIMARMFASRPRPISRAALETLSIIAYRQPVTRAQVEFIRGVDAGSIFKTLMERELVRCVGRKEVVGRPMLFGTTDEFLKVFNLTNLKDLPSLESFQPAPEAIQGARAKIEDEDQDVDIEQYISDNTEGGDSSDGSLDADDYSDETNSLDDGNGDDTDRELSDDDSSSEVISEASSAASDSQVEKSGAMAAPDDADDFTEDAEESDEVSLDTESSEDGQAITVEGAAAGSSEEDEHDTEDSDESDNMLSSEDARDDNDLKV